MGNDAKNKEVMTMKFNEIYWISIVEALGFGNHKINDILEYYKNAKNFWDEKVNLWKFSCFLSKKNIEKLKIINLNKAYKVVEKCNRLGYDIITIENPEYPQKLKNISNPPAVLYVKGSLPDMNSNLCIAIVGTRSSSVYGNKISFEMGYKLAKAGVVVISGGAIGIDCLSQKGALQAGGKTIAVLGCGINFNYLMANKNLRDNVARNGALISEYPPDFRCSSWTFPMRNRIISGLSDGVLVVEAGEKSGSLITADLALEQNRDLFAIPGNINSSVSDGTNKLIKICAKPVMKVEDILEEYYHLYNNLNKEYQLSLNKSNKNKEESEFERENLDSLSNIAKTLFSALTDKPCYVNDLADKSGLTPSKVLQGITELEIYGFIKSYAGNRYSRL